MKRKEYTAPKLRSESVKIGVFGDYGGCGNHNDFQPIGFLNPFFRLCCR